MLGILNLGQTLKRKQCRENIAKWGRELRLPPPRPFLLPPSPSFFPAYTVDRLGQVTVLVIQGAFQQYVVGQRWCLECMRVCWVFAIIFSLFLNKNIFFLDLLLVAIYEVKFYQFSQVLFHEFLRITKLVSGQYFVFLLLIFWEQTIHR